MSDSKSVDQVERLHGHLIGRRFADAKSLLDAPAQGRLMSAEEVQTIVCQQLGHRMSGTATLRFGDNHYYLPTRDEIDFILTDSRLEQKQFMAERFDCDDFAFYLKGEISAHAYQAGQLTCGLCAGIAWGHFGWNTRGYHAVNWYLDTSGLLYFIEPQWDMFWPVERCQQGVDLILA